MLKSYGYYFVELETSVTNNDNNSVDIIYNFELGKIAKIKKIKFIGDKIYKDSTLRNIIVSEETKFWKFITRNKFLDQVRIDLDQKRLLNFYKNRGFYNAKVKSSTAIISDNNQFDLIFNINAGEKYFFDSISFDKEKKFPQNIFEDFNKKFTKLKGKKYSKKIVDKIIDEINKKTLLEEFIFVNSKFQEKIKKDNKIDIIISFEDSEKFFVDRINIFGNYITDEKVIRNALIIDEGDPYNQILFDKSISAIKSKNIFKSVTYAENDDTRNKIINITVEEKPTGEIFAGAGTGTTGHTLSAGIKENNYLGLGIKLDTNLTLTEESIKGRFSVINPNFKNSDKSIKTVIENTTSDFMSSAGYKTSRTGLVIGTGFEQYQDLFLNLELSNYYENLETSSSANSIIKKQEGDYFENLLTYSISLNKLDQNYQPTDGYKNTFSQK